MLIFMKMRDVDPMTARRICKACGRTITPDNSRAKNQRYCWECVRFIGRSKALRLFFKDDLDALPMTDPYPHVYNDGVDIVDYGDLKAQLAAVMAEALTPREEKLIRMHFGLDDGNEHTLEELVQSFAVTRERIRQIEAKALSKLRHPRRSGPLLPFVGWAEWRGNPPAFVDRIPPRPVSELKRGTSSSGGRLEGCAVPSVPCEERVKESIERVSSEKATGTGPTFYCLACGSETHLQELHQFKRFGLGHYCHRCTQLFIYLAEHPEAVTA